MGPDGQERAQIDEHVLGRARDEKQQEQKELHVCLVPQKMVFCQNGSVDGSGSRGTHAVINCGAGKAHAQKAQGQPSPGTVQKPRHQFHRFAGQHGHHHLQHLQAQKCQQAQKTAFVDKRNKRVPRILLRQHGPDLVSICNAEHGQRQQKRRAQCRARVFFYECHSYPRPVFPGAPPHQAVCAPVYSSRVPPACMIAFAASLPT